MTKKLSEVILLECPRCLNTRRWVRTEGPPGTCSCGSYQFWRVIKEPRQRGFVIVMSDKGRQELYGPLWREDPTAWKPETK